MKRTIFCLMLACVAGCGGDSANNTSATATGNQQSTTEVAKFDAPAVDIFAASAEGKLEIVKQHIAAGTDINQPKTGDELKNTPLMLAAVFGRTEVAKTLIDAKANLDLQDKDGSTALHKSALFCHEEIVKELLANGADKDIKNKDGSVALTLVQGPFGDIKGLVFKPASEPLDYEHIQATRPKIAVLLGGSATPDENINLTDLVPEQVKVKEMFDAVVKGDVELVKKHIANGVNLNERNPNGDKMTALILAAFLGRTEIAKALIDAGADLNVQDKDRATALINSSFMAHEEIVRELIEGGADLSLKNKDGYTAVGVVRSDFEDVEGIYQLLDEAVFKRLGEPLDFQRIKVTRPVIFQMLRNADSN